ncbi:MAG: EamA family transporter [Hyphomicrobiales bacterium]
MSVAEPRTVSLAHRFPPHAFFLASAVFHYLGPSFAVLLFAQVDVLGVAWLRIASAAAIFSLWRRPWRLIAKADRRTRLLMVGLGATLAVMNCVFYLAIDRLPLATVASIEFVATIGVALFGLRGLRNLMALIAAVAGVYMLIGFDWSTDWLGLGLAVANSALFALYIILGHAISRSSVGSGGVDGLAAAMLIAFVVVMPIGFVEAWPALISPTLLAAGIGVGVTSSVIPYICDQLAMARLPRATFALLLALLPATAAIVGAVVLRQIPNAAELSGIALVVLGVALHKAER